MNVLLGCLPYSTITLHRWRGYIVRAEYIQPSTAEQSQTERLCTAAWQPRSTPRPIVGTDAGGPHSQAAHQQGGRCIYRALHAPAVLRRNGYLPSCTFPPCRLHVSGFAFRGTTEGQTLFVQVQACAAGQRCLVEPARSPLHSLQASVCFRITMGLPNG